jgi:tetratricopeptide (TPR) repeat protein
MNVTAPLRSRQLGLMVAIASALLAPTGCRRTPAPTESARTRAPDSSATAAVPSAGEALPFIADDFPAALLRARGQRKPLFVDAWAPWCHTCLSLRAYVFNHPALAAWRDRFVWLALDTEKQDNPGNAAFVAAHPIDTWPTLFIINAEDQAVRATWRGALKVDELIAWLAEATGGSAPTGARERSAEAHLGDLRRQKDHATCVTEARAALRWMAPGTSRLNVAIEGLTCAGRLTKGSSAAGSEPATALAAAIETMVNDPAFPLLPDDRSNGFSTLVEAAENAHDEARVRQLATRWLAQLDQAAGAAPTPAARAVFDSHRVEAALALGQPEAAIAALQASARDFPKDYNPPARLARLYLSAGRIAEARAEIDRALALAYGPRRKRLLQLQGEIAAAAAHPTAAKPRI